MKYISKKIKINTLIFAIAAMVFIVPLFSTKAASHTSYTESDTVSQTRQVQEFVRDSSSLINRIGSLVIGSPSIPSFLSGESSNCINHENLIFNDWPNNEIASETCLSVVGESIFRFLNVDTPAYFFVDSGTNSTAPVFNSYSSYLANYASYIVVGSFDNGVLNMGLGDIFIVDDTSASNESILVDGLKRLDALEDFAPRDTTTKTDLCADSTGVLFTCASSAPSETYSWVEGDWGTCSVPSDAVCNGSWTTNNSCQPNFAEVANDTVLYTVNVGGTYLGTAESYCTGIQSESFCNSVQASPGGTDPNTSVCAWSYSNITTQCSASNPPNESTCIGQDSACSWTDAGISVTTRTVTCQDSSGTIVADSFCDDVTRPATSSDDPSVAPNICTSPETYSWNIGEYSLCRDGIQQRTVTCLQNSDSSVVDDSFCPPPKPAESSLCPSEVVGIPDGNWFVCGTDGNWKMGPSANSTIVAATSNYSTASACGPGATAPVNDDAGAGGEDFYNADMRCWDAVPSDCSCFTTSGNITNQRC